MRLLKFKSESAKKTNLLFLNLYKKQIKTLTIDEIKAEIATYFGMNHTTLLNYRKSFLNLGFFKSAGYPPSIADDEHFEINYNKVMEYLKRVNEIEQDSSNN